MSERTRLLFFLTLWVIVLGTSRSADAQQIRVENGATLTAANGGVLDLHGTTMNFGALGDAARLKEMSKGRVTGGRLTATRRLNRPSSVDVAGLGAELSASVDLGAVAVTRGHQTHELPGDRTSIERFYDLSPSTNNRGLNASLTIHYAHAELGTLSESSLAVFKSQDGTSTWRLKGADARDAAANTVTVDNVQAFSQWTLGPSNRPTAGRPSEPPGRGAPGKLTLASSEAAFTARGSVQLRWRFPSNPSGDVWVERQPGTGTPSREEGWTILASQIRPGLTSESEGYQFLDNDLPFTADTLAYRIGRDGPDGSAQYSDVLSVARERPRGLQLKPPVPNPARSRVTVRYAVPEQTESVATTLELYDVLGREVNTVIRAVESGRHQTQLSVIDLPSGVYFLRLQSGGHSVTQRLTIVQ